MLKDQSITIRGGELTHDEDDEMERNGTTVRLPGTMVAEDGRRLFSQYRHYTFKNCAYATSTEHFIEHPDGRIERTTPLAFYLSCETKPKLSWWKRLFRGFSK